MGENWGSIYKWNLEIRFSRSALQNKIEVQGLLEEVDHREPQNAKFLVVERYKSHVVHTLS